MFQYVARHAEFARAAVEINSEGNLPPVYYCGILGEKLSEVQSIVQSQCYKKWDDSPEAPPKTRPREDAVVRREVDLEVLAFNPGLDKPVWPSTLDARFTEGPEKVELQKMKEDFEAEFGRGNAAAAEVQSQQGGSIRVSGSCDYGFDGADPLDTDRMIEPAFIAAADLPPDRRAWGQKKK